MKHFLAICTTFIMIFVLSTAAYAEGAKYPITPMSGKVSLIEFESGIYPDEGTFTYTFQIDNEKSNFTGEEPTNGQVLTVTNGANGNIPIPLLEYEWEENTGVYVYKITQLETLDWEPLITNQDRYGRDFFPTTQYIYVDTNPAYKANEKWYQTIQKEGSASKGASLEFINLPVYNPAPIPPVLVEIPVGNDNGGDTSVEEGEDQTENQNPIEQEELEQNETTELAQTGDDNTIWMWLCGIAGIALVVMVIFYFKDLS